MAAMRFDAATSRRVEATYTTPDVVEQRRIIVGALSLQAGERVLDIGSGPGFLACEMASQLPDEWEGSRQAYGSIASVFTTINVHQGRVEEAQHWIDILEAFGTSGDAQERAAHAAVA
jgi:cyclopropane fatty-acyl-phospholipid synthase-like methyltransferase